MIGRDDIMMRFGVQVDVKNVPPLDGGFVPLAKFNAAFLATAKKPIVIAVERSGGLVSVFPTHIHGTKEMEAADKFYVERTVKFLLWARGGAKVMLCGDEAMAQYLSEVYAPQGKRAFDYNFMSKIFERSFEVVYLPLEDAPEAKENPQAIGRHLEGCRIGFDAGGSDRKVSAVVDGVPVYSEEVVWFPKITEDPEYHYAGIVEAFKTAASKMERVDAIGVSSAGIYIDNRTMAASLFIKVPEPLFSEKVKDIYIRAAKEIGADVPLYVANDGDVTALAGAMALGENGVLGIAMGTSQAAGYVDAQGNLTGWLSELAFAPVDGQENAHYDDWAGDIGCGVQYFSQDAVIRLAPSVGITLDAGLSPAEKLKVVQEAMEADHPGAIQIYETIGCYLGHALAYYADFYEILHVLLLGRVTSGKGGDIVLNCARQVLESEYPALSKQMNVQLPDEKSRRVGQSVAAASLPELR